MLVLPIKKVWFDKIRSREKGEEYREISPYYISRFKNLFSMYPYSHVPYGTDAHLLRLRNGYSSASPTIEITATLDIRQGREEWGAVPGKDYFVLSIRDVRDV